MKVFINTIAREKATGIDKWKGRDGRPMNKTKNGRFTGDTIQPLYNIRTGGLATGLSDLVENPWFGTDTNKLGKDWEYLSTKSEITRQELLEKKHGRVPGYYTDRPVRKGDKPGEVTFMQQFKVRLNDGSTVLDLTKAEDELAYYVALASKYVANSKRDVLDHKYPFATHYIAHTEEDEELLLRERKRKAVAFARLESDDLTEENRKLVVKALHWQKGNFDAKQAYNIIFSKIDTSDGNKPNSDADKFVKMTALLNDAKGREELNARALLHDLVDMRVVSSIKGTYKWVAKDLVIGDREADAVDFILDPNKQPEVDLMKKELSAKMLS